jgi:hypothetical protein
VGFIECFVEWRNGLEGPEEHREEKPKVSEVSRAVWQG